MKYGYGGKILRINLTKSKITKTELPESLVKEFLGARGFVIKTLYDELKPGIDPMSDKNILIAAVGPLTGALVPSASRTVWGTKSPLTGGYGESNCGGHFNAEMKYAGYDMIILEGKAPRPSFIYINDDTVEIRDAAKYWGRGSFETEKMLKDDLGEDFQISTIGPAGERGVKIACISHDFGRQAGRTGIGTVMGNKNIKAIAIRGTKSIPVFDIEGLIKQGKKMYQINFQCPGYELWQNYGTSSVVQWANRIGAFPTRNFKTGYFEPFQYIGGIAMRHKIVHRNKACYSCAMACGKYCHTKGKDSSGKPYDAYVEGPEYETTALMGGNLALDKIEDVAYANYLADEMGIDTISGGAIISFAIECFEKGIITKKDTDGMELKFGDSKTVFELIRKIAFREGIGDILAEGTRYAAGKWGGGSIDFAVQIKGLEQSGYESRKAPAMQLSYMTSDVGAHHRPSWAVVHDITTGRESVENKANRVIELQHIRPLFDTLGVCRLPWIEMGVQPAEYAEAYRLITGIQYSEAELLKISEKIWNLTRMFWFREIKDFGRKYDFPYPRVYKEKVPDGPTEGGILSEEKINALLDDYYSLRGWDKNGKPTPEKLKSLGLDKIIAKAT